MAAKARIAQVSKQLESLNQDSNDQEMEIEHESVVEQMEIDAQAPIQNTETKILDIIPAQVQELKLEYIRKINDQTIENDYRSGIKLQANTNALTESPAKVDTKPAIRINENFHHSKETDFKKLECEDERRVEAFKSRNSYGHSSESKIQHLMYQTSFPSLFEEDVLESDQRIMNKKFRHFTGKENRVDLINFDEIVKPYKTDFADLFNSKTIFDNLLDTKMKLEIKTNLELTEKNHKTEITQADERLDQDYQFKEFEFLIDNEGNDLRDNEELFSFNYIELEEILNRILYKPVQVELGLINKCLINHFLFDLNLEEHLKALRQYLLFENGTFAQKFVDEILEKISFKDFDYLALDEKSFDCESLISPIYISEAFSKTCSQIKSCKYIDNLSIRINKSKSNLNPQMISSSTNLLHFLSMIELSYKLVWPLNLIIDETSLISYNLIFGFLLQIKFVLSALNNVWYTLRRFGE